MVLLVYTQIMSLDSVDVIQSWTDPRLAAVTHDTRDLDLNKSQVDKVWKPEIHVVSGRHQMWDDHMALTVSKSGHVTFQQRFVVLFIYRCINDSMFYSGAQLRAFAQITQ
jgi:hypothetical protein